MPKTIPFARALTIGYATLLFLGTLYAVACNGLAPQQGDLCPGVDGGVVFVTPDGSPTPSGPVGPVNWTQVLYMPFAGVEYRGSIVKIDHETGAADLLITGISETVTPSHEVVKSVPCFRWAGPTLLMRATKDQPEGPVWVYPTPNPKEARAWTFAGLLEDGQVRFVSWKPGIGVEADALPPIEELPSAPFYLIDPTGGVTTEVAKVMMEHCVELANP